MVSQDGMTHIHRQIPFLVGWFIIAFNELKRQFVHANNRFFYIRMNKAPVLFFCYRNLTLRQFLAIAII
jgi:hypothetical protein